MKKILVFLIVLLSFYNALAQDNKEKYPDGPVGKILKKYVNLYDSIIVYGALCSGCISGAEEKLYVVYKKKNRCILDYYRSNNNLEDYNFSTYILGKSNGYYQIYKSEIDSITYAIDKGEEIFYISTEIDSGTIMTRGTLSDGPGQYFYFKFGNKIQTNLFCCGIDINEYKEKSKGLWMLMSAFNKERLED